MSQPDRDILISRYLDDAASDAEVAQLDRAMVADPALANDVVRLAYTDVLLRDAMPVEMQPEVAAPQFEEAEPVGTRSSLRLPLSRQWLAIAASVILAAGATWLAMRPSKPAGTSDPQVATAPATPAFVTAGPGVTVERGGERLRGADAPLADADRIRTAVGATATLTFKGERTTVEVMPQSVLLLGRQKSGKQFDLVAGTVSCDAAPQPADAPMIVNTAQASARVVGTKFKVATVAGWTRVQVSSGTVRVTRLTDGATVDVSGGQYVDIPGPGAPLASALGAATGRSMGDAWSVDLKPAGINE